MIILVTGALGRIGRAVIPALRNAGHQVIQLDKGDDFPTSPVDAIIHLAANAWEGHANISPRYQDIEITTRVVEYAEQFSVNRIVFASSIETEPTLEALGVVNAASYYKAAKLYGEALLEAYAHKHPGTHVSNLRLGTYSPEAPITPGDPINLVRITDNMLAYWFLSALEWPHSFRTVLAIGPWEATYQ